MPCIEANFDITPQPEKHMFECQYITMVAVMLALPMWRKQPYVPGDWPPPDEVERARHGLEKQLIQFNVFAEQLSRQRASCSCGFCVDTSWNLTACFGDIVCFQQPVCTIALRLHAAAIFWRCGAAELLGCCGVCTAAAAAAALLSGCGEHWLLALLRVFPLHLFAC